MSSSAKQGDEGDVIAWACMAATGTGSLIFIDDVTADDSCIMNSEVYRNILSAAVLPVNASKLIGRRFILHQDNDPKHTAKATPELLRAKTWTIHHQRRYLAPGMQLGYATKY